MNIHAHLHKHNLVYAICTLFLGQQGLMDNARQIFAIFVVICLNVDILNDIPSLVSDAKDNRYIYKSILLSVLLHFFSMLHASLLHSMPILFAYFLHMVSSYFCMAFVAIRRPISASSGLLELDQAGRKSPLCNLCCSSVC